MNRGQNCPVVGNCYCDVRPCRIPLAIANQLVKAFCHAMTIIIPVGTAGTESTLLAVVLAPSSAVRQLVLDVVAAVWPVQKCQFGFGDASAAPWQGRST